MTIGKQLSLKDLTTAAMASLAFVVFLWNFASPAFAQCGATNESLAKFLPNDGEEDETFGHSIDVSESYAIIGAPRDDDRGIRSGSAYIFQWNSALGKWEQADFDNDNTPDKLTASDGAIGDYFGESVAISGDYALAGAWGNNAGGVEDAGAAYIFKRTGSEWRQIDFDNDGAPDKLMADDGAEGDYFGNAVALSGDYALIGAYGADVGGGSVKDAGAAYVFSRQTDGSWLQEAKLTLGDAAEDDFFSRSAVSISSTDSGTFAIVGARDRYTAGAAYIFKRNEDGTWTDSADGELILTGDLSGGDDFGHAVSISADYAVVGAPGDSIDGNAKAGAAYIFRRGAGDVWTKEGKLTAGLNAGASDQLGWSTAVANGYAVIGAIGDDDTGINAGAVYTFKRDDGGKWTQVDKIAEAQGERDDYFGQDVAVLSDGSRAVTGASEDNEGAENAGAFFAFDICETGPGTPTFEPGGGVYGGVQDVAPQLPEGAENCYYTLKLFFAETPYFDSAGSTLYLTGETIAVDGEFQTAKVLSVVCYDAQGNRGEVGSAEYFFTPLTAPTFDPSGGTYTQAVQVTPGLPDGAVESYYTLDGSEPDKTAGILYEGEPIEIDGVHNETVTLKMVAYNDQGDKGQTGTADYTFDKRMAGPSFDPEGGTYTSAVDVTLSPAEGAAETYYTLDGTEPDKAGASSALYETGTTIPIDAPDGETVALSAVSYDEAGNKGRISSAEYTFDTSAVVITFSPSAGTFSAAQTVTPTLPPNTSESHYTLNGDEPDKTSPTYDGGTIDIAGNHGETISLKMVAYDAGGDEIARNSADYVFDMRIDAPTLTPAAGTYNTAQAVTATLSPDAAATYYTLDGSEPDETDAGYPGGAIAIDGAHGETVTLKMVSYDAQGLKGKVAVAAYTFDKTLAPPTFSPGEGTYNAPLQITPTLDPDAAETYYTIDGSEPDKASGAPYGGDAIAVDAAHGETVSLKMVSYDSQGNKGEIGTAVYAFDKQGPAAPIFSPPGGTFQTPPQIGIVLADDAQTTYYTLDGKEPDQTDNEYGSAFSIAINDGETVTLKMVSYDAVGNKGATGTAVYTVEKFPGDINGDNVIDLADAVLGLKIIVGISLPPDQNVEPGSDVDKNEQIGLPEIVYILQEVSGR